jgi:uncharacterized membrane protein
MEFGIIRRRPLFGLLALLVLAGVLLRIVNLLMEPNLWADEIFSVALAESPLVDILLATLRFDTHPPLYYLQLHGWAAVADGDRWFILNSTLQSIAAIAVLFVACRKIFGFAPAIWAAAIFALMPLQLFFAENVRMYAMVMILEISLWYILQRIEQSSRASRRHLLAALGLGLGLTLTHGLGFFVAFFLFLSTTARMMKLARPREVIRLVVVYGVVALGALYPLAIGTIRQTEGLASLDLPTIGIHLTLTFLGMEFPWPTLAGFLILPLMLLLPLTQPSSRWTAGLLVLLPLCVLLFISVAFKPVFIYRTLGLFLPFAAIALGLYADAVFRARMPLQQSTAMAVTTLLLMASINYSYRFEKGGYRDLIGTWEARSAADAIMLTNSPSEFWAVLRYLDDGRGRSSALAIQPPVRNHMLRLKEKLEAAGRGGLFGRSDHAAVGLRLVYPYIPTQIVESEHSFWLLNPFAEDCAIPALPDMQFRKVEEYFSKGQHLIRCQKSPASLQAPLRSASVRG